MQLGATNWPTSPDDDGLEPVQSASLLHNPRPPERTLLGMPPPPSRRPISNPPTVVVDPESQVPSAPFFPLPDHLPIEPTQILRGRQVDRLRGQLLAQRRAHMKGMSRKLALWCVAGALAVALGAGFAAVAFAPSSTASSSTAPSSTALSSSRPSSRPGDTLQNNEVPQPVTSRSAPIHAARTAEHEALAQHMDPAGSVAMGSPSPRGKTSVAARSPLLESGLEPENLAADRRSPFQESGLAHPAQLPTERDPPPPTEPAPSVEPEPVTLEELMRD